MLFDYTMTDPANGSRTTQEGIRLPVSDCCGSPVDLATDVSRAGVMTMPGGEHQRTTLPSNYRHFSQQH